MDNKTIYEKFDWSALKESHLQGKITKVIELIPDDVITIADIGCGNGVITNVLGQQFEVTGIDRSKHALSMVNTKKLKASADDIPLPDDSFDIFNGEIEEIKILSKKYIFITVPNDENHDKLSIKCPKCDYIYNSPNHLRSFRSNDFNTLFHEYRIVTTFVFGKRVRYYNPQLLKRKKKTSPPRSWIPNYWMKESKRTEPR